MRLGIYLPSPVFSHGQLYVALSRAERFEGVRVLVEDYDDKQRRCQSSSDSSGALLVRQCTLKIVDRDLLLASTATSAPKPATDDLPQTAHARDPEPALLASVASEDFGVDDMRPTSADLQAVEVQALPTF